MSNNNLLWQLLTKYQVKDTKRLEYGIQLNLEIIGDVFIEHVSLKPLLEWLNTEKSDSKAKRVNVNFLCRVIERINAEKSVDISMGYIQKIEKLELELTSAYEKIKMLNEELDSLRK